MTEKLRLKENLTYVGSKATENKDYGAYTVNNTIIHTPEKFFVFCLFLMNEGWTVGTWVSTLYRETPL